MSMPNPFVDAQLRELERRVQRNRRTSRRWIVAAIILGAWALWSWPTNDWAWVNLVTSFLWFLFAAVDEAFARYYEELILKLKLRTPERNTDHGHTA